MSTRVALAQLLEAIADMAEPGHELPEVRRRVRRALEGVVEVLGELEARIAKLERGAQ